MIFNITASMKLLINNYAQCHYETIESSIVKHREILKINDEISIDIYLNLDFDDPHFREYINKKYPQIKFQKIHDFDYLIECTIYDRDFHILEFNPNKGKKYIAHEITDGLKTNSNVYFLTPLSKYQFIYSDVLPFSEEKKISSIPIYVIQGNFEPARRNYDLLSRILDSSYNYEFKIKLVGRGNCPIDLKKYGDKIIVRNNLNFIDYHKEFLDAYCILPLITKKSHPNYYQKKLTSTINYARGYKLKCLIDKDLQEIYNLEDVEIFNDINDIGNGFLNTLKQFYDKS